MNAGIARLMIPLQLLALVVASSASGTTYGSQSSGTRSLVSDRADAKLKVLAESSNMDAGEAVSWDAEQRLRDLDIRLTEMGTPVANYVDVVKTGNLLFLAGKGPAKPDGSYVTGKLGSELTIAQGREAAKLAALSHISILRRELGNLNKVRRVVRVFGTVNSEPSFTAQSQVMDGYSDLLVEVFGEKGKHARSAIGVNALPLDFAVEVQMVVEVEE